MFSLLKYAKNYKKQLFLGPFFKFLEAVFELFLPIIMAQLVDKGIKQNNQQYILQMSGLMVLLSIIGLGCVLICQYYSSYASQGFGTQLRNQMMKKINEFSYGELNQFGTNTLITWMTNDINQLQLALAMLIRLVIRAPFLSVGSVAMAFYIDTSAGWIFLAVLSLFCIILYFFVKKTIPFYTLVQEKLDLLNRKIGQNLSGVRVIRAFVKQKHEIHEAGETTDELASINVRVTNISALLTPITTLIMNLAILLLLYFGALKVNIGGLQQGEVLALINYMTQMLLALIVVSNLVVIFTRAFASASRVNDVLNVTPSITKIENPLTTVASFDEPILFNQVAFRYPSSKEYALQQLQFTIQPYTTFGITGSTGSAKSTLIQLIPRFFDITKGQLMIGKTEVSQFDLTLLRQKIAYVPQKAVLFTGTIRENLQWGNSQATDIECWKALEIAQCKEFVESLNKGLDTPLYENGRNLSGGQRQRLTIARALIKQPKVLILDDSLSALDFQTDLKLRTSLRNNLKQTTLIIVSQRISSIRQAEQILVLNNGHQIALGTHEELLKDSLEYQEMVAIQEEGVTDIEK